MKPIRISLLFAVLSTQCALLIPSSAVAAATYTFTTIDVPNASVTQVFSINASSQMVGIFNDAARGVVHGFLRDTNGAFTIFNIPLAFTQTFGINDTGQIVGFFTDAATNKNHGFRLDSTSFTIIDVPGASATVINRIDNSGRIVGSFNDATGTHGFFRDSSGNFTTIDVPGAIATEALGINDSGQIVGEFNDDPGFNGFNHGFLRDTNGTFTTIDVPGASLTTAWDINNIGQIVGVFGNPGTHGYIRDTTGSFTTIDVPGGVGIAAFGIDSGGQIVGTFANSSGRHGFLATPTIPVPTATPALAAFPSGSQLFTEVGSFLQNHGQEFSPESQSFLNSAVTFLDPLLSNPTLKKIADTSARLIATEATLTNVILSFSPTNTRVEKLLGVTSALVGPFLPQDARILVAGLGVAKHILESAAFPTTLPATLASINSFIWGQYVAPQLSILAHDPFDPNYQSVVVANIPPVVPLPSTGDQQLDAALANLESASLQALIFLQSVNTSFDRYNSALAVGDPISAGLQLEAILYFLSRYNDAVIMAANLWNQLAASLQNITYEPNALRNLQTEVAVDGFPSEIIDYLSALGLTATEIDSVSRTFLGLDSNQFSGTSFQALSGLSASLFAVSTERTFIDIKPGDSLNSVNPKSKGEIPVAIFSTTAFNAVSQVDPNSLTFGRTGDELSLAFCNSNGEDVNGDGLLDLVCHFDTQKTAFTVGDTIGVLKGRNSADTPFLSSDSVRIAPSK